MKSFVWFVIGAIIGVCLYSIIYNPVTYYKVEKRVEYDTITHVDTTTYFQPIPKDTLIVRYVTDTLKVIEVDSDSNAVVEIPISQTIYEGDNYQAWVSGYRTSLDSLNVYSTSTVFTKTETIVVPQPTTPKRWGIGITGGVGVTPHGIEPYVGIGITGTFFTF